MLFIGDLLITSLVIKGFAYGNPDIFCYIYMNHQGNED